MSALTPWFPANTKPVRRGAYQTYRPRLGEGYSFWDGKKWGNQYSTADRAKLFGYMTGIQEKEWRGLAAPADAP